MVPRTFVTAGCALPVVGFLSLACASAGPVVPDGVQQAAETAPQRGGVMHYGVRQPLDNLDPYASFGVSVGVLNQLRFEALITPKVEPGVDPRIKDEKAPLLAERWELKDPTTWLFYLRKGIKWIDGVELTADDVIFSVRMLGDPEKRYRYRTDVEGIAELKAPERYTVQMTLKQPDSNFLNRIGQVIVPKHIGERGTSFTKIQDSIGTGQFRLLAFDSRAGFAVERNPDYWGTPAPYLDGVVAHYGLDDSGMMAAFIARQLDLVTVDTTSLGIVKQNVPDVKQNKVMSAFNPAVYFNETKPPYNDPRVRRAFHLALDRQAMLLTLTQGEGVISPPGVNGMQELYAMNQEELMKLPGWNPTTKQQDIAEAKRLLAEAGVQPGFTDKILFSRAASTAPPVAEMVVGQLRTPWD